MIIGRIIAPHFVAGIVLKKNTVVDAAPIVRYMMGWNRTQVRNYVARKGWEIKKVKSDG